MRNDKKSATGREQDNTSNMMFFPPMADDSMIKYYKQELRITLHHFYIVDEIGDVDEFLDLINTLKTAEEHDTIFIYLNTPGGDLYTAIQLISAMRQTNATVVTSIEGMVASAGTLIFLAGHKYVVHPHCTFMLHNYSHWVGGKGNEVSLRVKHAEIYFRELAEDLYGKFLTEVELADLINGKDFWMTSKEVLSRLSPTEAASSMAGLEKIDEAAEAAVTEAVEAAATLAELEAEDAALDEAPKAKKPRKKRIK